MFVSAPKLIGGMSSLQGLHACREFCVHRYRVVERWPDDRRLGLSCHMGRHHLARAIGGIPAAGACLNGDKPHLGFAMLSCAESGRIFRVQFETVNQAALLAAPGWMPPGSSAVPIARPTESKGAA